MKKFRELISRPFVTAALFALALVLLGGSTLGGARAALTIESNLYESDIETNKIDVALLENGTVKEGNDKLLSALKSEKPLKIGYPYEEVLKVKNTGTSAEYVRVTVYKYWKDKNGKFADMESDWIILNFVEKDGWRIDKDSTTEERTVLYYDPKLPAGGETPMFLESIAIAEEAARTVSQVETGGDGSTTITTTYIYNGCSFCLEVHVDGVQTHNADKAKLSAWGVK